jgi:hypothetical protein
MRNRIQKPRGNTEGFREDIAGKFKVKILVPDKRGLQEKKGSCQKR